MVKNPPASSRKTGDMGLMPGLGQSLGGGNGNPFQYSCLGNPMDRGATSIGSQRVRHDRGTNNNMKMSQDQEG